MNITIKCQECGECLEVTSVVPKTNNVGDLESINYTAKPCRMCQKSAYIQTIATTVSIGQKAKEIE